MKILFLTLARIDEIETQGIYPDLLRMFRDNGHEVTIITPIERKFGIPTMYFSKNGVNILKVWTTNIQKTNLLEKGVERYTCSEFPQPCGRRGSILLFIGGE